MDVTDDFLSRLITNPRRGLRELIDNALDADAGNIEVVFRRSTMEAIDSVVVRDDGEGMTAIRATDAFGHLGGSWKRRQSLSPGGRLRRGHKGSGRWAAFALGSDVSWRSTAFPVVGLDQSPDLSRVEAVEVRGSASALGEFDVEPAVADGSATGTVVTVKNVYPSAQVIDSYRPQLTAHYATELRRQPTLTITVDGRRLNPADFIDDTHALPVRVEGVDDGSVVLTVVDWSREVKAPRPALVLTDAAGNGLFDHLEGITRASWAYTAYLAWDGFVEHRDDLPMPMAHSDEVAAVIDAGLEVLRDHIRGRQDAARASLLAQWKEEQSYPYSSRPDGPVEEAERDLFDLVAVTAAPAIQNNDVEGRKLVLRLLKEAVGGNPSHLMTVLREVVALDEEQLAELAGLLERTNLPSVITAAGVVTHRLDILAGLEAILHRREEAAKVREPDHLHQIVAREPWLLGDEYTTSVSERGLAEVLRSHQRTLGEERVLVDESDPEPVGTILVEGRPGRIDLMLTRVSPLDANVRQNLVVELKRPGVALDSDHVSQLEKYSFEIREDSRFHGQDVRWDFVLIGTRMTDFVRDKAEALERSSQPNFRLRVMTWDQLISTRRHQMKFVQRALDVNTSADSGVARLRAVHAEHLPDDL
ncbi:MAG TPA: ATP-binding protein [Marmoricola sp.]|nr:ATP-binding protein [Marmoricola sp.]